MKKAQITLQHLVSSLFLLILLLILNSTVKAQLTAPVPTAAPTAAPTGKPTTAGASNTAGPNQLIKDMNAPKDDNSKVNVIDPDNPNSYDFQSRIDELRKKLEDKSYDIAKLYFQMEEYKASVVAFENLLNTYPGTEYKELALFTMLKAEFTYANKSVESKKEERFKNTLDIYYKLVDNFPQSRYLRDAEKLYDVSKSELQKLEGPVKNL